MRWFSHIIISLIVIVTYIIKFNFNEISFSNILLLLASIFIILIIANFFVWLIHFIEEKTLNFFEKRKQKNYSMMDWIGDTNLSLELYNELSDFKTFNHEKFHENYLTIKQKIKTHFTTIEQLKGFKFYLELKTGSQKYISILNSTQTILIAIIIPSVLTVLNLKNITSIGSSINAILFLIFWLILLNAIDFIAKQMDKMKVLLRLVNECIEENE
jgi:hypothetical protein